MTELQKRYVELRDTGHRHRKAMRELSQQVGVDVATIRRVLERADREDGWGPRGKDGGEGPFFGSRSADNRQMRLRARRLEIAKHSPSRALAESGGD